MPTSAGRLCAIAGKLATANQSYHSIEIFACRRIGCPLTGILARLLTLQSITLASRPNVTLCRYAGHPHTRLSLRCSSAAPPVSPAEKGSHVHFILGGRARCRPFPKHLLSCSV